MKYNLYVNQKVICNISPDIEIKEAIILDYIIFICQSNNAKIKEKRINGFTWINYNKIIEDLPILKFKSKSSITEKIDKLREYWYVETQIIKQNLYIKTTDLIDELFAEMNTGVQYNEQRCSVQWTNNNIYNNINNNNIIKEEIKENKEIKIKYTLDDYDKLYKEYMSISKMDIKYWYKSKVILFIEQLTKEYTIDELRKAMMNYFSTISDKKYSLSPKNFFSNNKRGDHYRVFEWFLNNDKTIEKEFNIWF